MKYDTPEIAEQVVAETRANNPEAIEVRALPDGSVAILIDLMFTRAICLGATAWGYSTRFCFEDRERATAAFATLQSEDEVPLGWIARRPE